MKRHFRISFILMMLLCSAAAHVSAGQYPSRGSEQKTVRAEYGEPNAIEGPVGQPPITRWIYSDFTVVFEYDRVLHAFPRQPELEQRPASSLPERPQTGDHLTLPSP